MTVDLPPDRYWLLRLSVTVGDPTPMFWLFAYHWQWLLGDPLEKTTALEQADGAP